MGQQRGLAWILHITETNAIVISLAVTYRAKGQAKAVAQTYTYTRGNHRQISLAAAPPDWPIHRTVCHIVVSHQLQPRWFAAALWQPTARVANPRQILRPLSQAKRQALLVFSRLQLWRRVGALINLDNPARCPIRRRLGEAPHVSRIESQTDDGVATPPLALVDDSADGVVAARIQHGREPLQLAAGHALEDHAQAGADVARPHRNAVDCAEDLLDAVAGEIVHGYHRVEMRH